MSRFTLPSHSIDDGSAWVLPLADREVFAMPCAVSCHRGHFKPGGHIMKPVVPAAPFLVSAFAIALAVPAVAQDKAKPPATYPGLPSEIPAKFKPVTDSFD